VITTMTTTTEDWIQPTMADTPEIISGVFCFAMDGCSQITP
jgi:hypothetical protein